VDSGYGRGTTKEDVAAGNTSLRFHEDQHYKDYENYVDENPVPKPDIEVGMTVRAYKAAMRQYNLEIRNYTLDMTMYSKLHTDCVGVPMAGCP
jgi:hypothetical protein